MVQAVGAVSPALSATSPASASAVQAQLDLCQRKLSDQVNCASAKTPEGKKSIDELSARIGALKSRLERLAGVSGADAPTTLRDGDATTSPPTSSRLVDTYA